jgi:hypothetical protein
MSIVHYSITRQIAMVCKKIETQARAVGVAWPQCFELIAILGATVVGVDGLSDRSRETADRVNEVADQALPLLQTGPCHIVESFLEKSWTTRRSETI